MADEKKLAEFLSLIKKLVSFKVKDPDHVQFKEDIANETFIKLYKSGAFDKYSLDEKQESLIATSYIKKTVHSCYMDYLTKAGINRRLTKQEQEETGHKTMNIIKDDIDEPSSFGVFEPEQSSHYSVEQYLMAKQAYKVIQDCFSSSISSVSNAIRANFLKEAFWEADSYGLPLKKLAVVLGYENSNPTQDFNRFVTKVSDCTQKFNINIVNSGEQIEFLRQIIESEGVSA